MIQYWYSLYCQYLVATVSISGHCIGKNKEWTLLTKFINHIDNTLIYKSQVELSIQMSDSNSTPYQNAAATRTCGEATALPAADAGCRCYIIEWYWASSRGNPFAMYSKGTNNHSTLLDPYSIIPFLQNPSISSNWHINFDIMSVFFMSDIQYQNNFPLLSVILTYQYKVTNCNIWFCNQLLTFNNPFSCHPEVVYLSLKNTRHQFKIHF